MTVTPKRRWFRMMVLIAVLAFFVVAILGHNRYPSAPLKDAARFMAMASVAVVGCLWVLFGRR